MCYNDTSELIYIIMTKEELWQAVLAQIQFKISTANFATWFKNTQIIEKKKGSITVSVPNAFSREWLEQKYNKFILKILHSVDRETKEVKYIVSRAEPKKEKYQKAVPVQPLSDQLGFEEFKINKKTNLNPRYTFESFVVGPFNEMAQAASCAISKDPGKVYNPLFVYGGVGLGKTHLLQSIGNEVLKNFPDKEIKYIPAERLSQELLTQSEIEALKASRKNIKRRMF